MNELNELKSAVKDEMNDRQVKVFELTEDGYYQDEIAGMLEISQPTISRTMIEIVNIFEPYREEYQALKDLDDTENETVWDTLSYSQLKGDTKVDRIGRAVLPMYCILHVPTPSDEEPKILSKAARPSRVCYECKEKHNLPNDRRDYPEWLKELIRIEDRAYDKERWTEYFVNAEGLDPANEEDFADLD